MSFIQICTRGPRIVVPAISVSIVDSHYILFASCCFSFLQCPPTTAATATAAPATATATSHPPQTPWSRSRQVASFPVEEAVAQSLCLNNNNRKVRTPIASLSRNFRGHFPKLKTKQCAFFCNCL